jgi:hypothetical protein
MKSCPGMLFEHLLRRSIDDSPRSLLRWTSSKYTLLLSLDQYIYTDSGLLKGLSFTVAKITGHARYAETYSNVTSGMHGLCVSAPKAKQCNTQFECLIKQPVRISVHRLLTRHTRSRSLDCWASDVGRRRKYAGLWTGVSRSRIYNARWTSIGTGTPCALSSNIDMLTSSGLRPQGQVKRYQVSTARRCLLAR